MSHHAPFRVLLPDQQTWAPKPALPPGAAGTVLAGDPEQGHFALKVSFPAGFQVPRHTHSALLRVLILSGAMTIHPDGAAPVVIPAGGYFELPPGLMYTAEVAGPCDFVIDGDHGFDIIYGDLSDDPRHEALAS